MPLRSPTEPIPQPRPPIPPISNASPSHRRRSAKVARPAPTLAASSCRAGHSATGGSRPMIPRYQRILFWILVASITLSTLFLLRGCRQAHQRLAAPADTTPIDAPTISTTQDAALYLASDATGVIAVDERSLACPSNPSPAPEPAQPPARRLRSAPIRPSTPRRSRRRRSLLHQTPPRSHRQRRHHSRPARVVDLHEAFAASHPSGVLTETLTLQSIIGTLHAAFPDLSQIRFLVNGQPRDTPRRPRRPAAHLRRHRHRLHPSRTHHRIPARAKIMTEAAAPTALQSKPTHHRRLRLRLRRPHRPA